MSDWGGEDLSLEKLKIHSRLESIESHILQDKEDTKLFRAELKEFMKEHVTSRHSMDKRVSELETVRGIHSKFIWTAIPIFFGLIVKNAWDMMRGKS